jgi:transposase
MNAIYSRYISVGIDVGADFSMICIMSPNFDIIRKPFKVVHTDLESMAKAALTIKKAEEQFQMKSQVFLESTGIYHFPLFCYLRAAGLEVFVLNPLITNSNRSENIRKVKNDKLDSKKIAKLGLNPKIKRSLIPNEFVLNLRFLCREYYSLSDDRTALVNKLGVYVRMVFPAYIGIFSDIAGDTSMAVLSYAQSLDHLLNAPKAELVSLIAKTARKGMTYAENKYNAIIRAITISKEISMLLPDIFGLTHSIINHIKLIDDQMDATAKTIEGIVNANSDFKFVEQIRIIDSITGVGFMSAVTIMCEIGDFSAFKSPKQLFAFFGLDPSVNESGKFKGTKNPMSKRGSRLARRVLHTIALACIRNKTNGIPNNPVLQAYYQEKTKSKPKMVALGAVMHKVCNIIFALLRDDTCFVLITPEEHVYSHDLVRARNLAIAA